LNLSPRKPRSARSVLHTAEENARKGVLKRGRLEEIREENSKGKKTCFKEKTEEGKIRDMWGAV